MKAHQEISRSRADNLDDGKRKAEQLASDYMRYGLNAEMPNVDWQMNEILKKRIG
jgi:hypothetical protein